MKGKLYGVGVGPGDPELLTLKALRILKESDIIAIPAKDRENCTAYAIVHKVYPEIVKKEFIYLDFPMTKDKKVLESNIQRNKKQIAQKLVTGKNIAFITLGDPTIYSTFLYVNKGIKDEGYDVEIISGIPSFCAIAAKLGISLGEKEEEIHIIPATYGITETIKMPGTKILMKAGKKLKDIKEAIGSKNYFLAMAENCGMPDEKMVSSVRNIPDEAGYFTTVIIKNEAND